MDEKKLPVGTIMAARYTYGGETQLWKFYKILGYTPTKVRLIEIEGKTVYDDGKTGPHYYDDPRHCIPVEYFGRYNEIGVPFLRKYRFSKYDGEMCVTPEEFYYASGAWDGKPLEEYNYH